MANFSIREMTRNELDTVLGWSEQESWRPGLADADYFYPTDPHGFFIGLLDGEPIASISGVKYGDDYGFIGLYIVKPEWRGQGYGASGHDLSARPQYWLGWRDRPTRQLSKIRV